MLKMMSVLLLALSSSAFAQISAVPKEKVPEILLNQLRLMEADFVVALQKDCAARVCYPRGCVYSSHEMVSLQGNRALPGLSQEGESRVVGEPQYVLTGSSCEYAYEQGMDKQDVQNLNRRLESKLSKGPLRVSLKAIEIPAASKEVPLLNTELSVLEKIGQQLLEYFAWILGMVLVTLALILSLWAWRRIGRDSKEDELRFLLYKQKLEAEALMPPAAIEQNLEDPDLVAFKGRLVQLQGRHDKNPGPLQLRLQMWLEEEQFGKVACSLLLLADAEQRPMGDFGQNTLLRLQFSEFLQVYSPSNDERRAVLKELEQEQALHAHFDQSQSLRVRQLFSQYDAVSLLARNKDLEARRALLALSPGLKIQELVAALEAQDIPMLTQSFWESARVKTAALSDWLGEKAEGSQHSSQVTDASWILGFLFSRLSIEQRTKFAQFEQKPWTKRLFYPELLTELPAESAQNILLSVDAIALNHWYAFLDAKQQAFILPMLPVSYRSQLRGMESHRINAHLVMATIKNYAREAAEHFRRGA